jgi:predicted nucleic acid-binding protein
MIVLDSSAIVEVLADTPKAPRVMAELTGQQIHAPELISFEVQSAIRGNVRAHKLTPAEAILAMRTYEDVEYNLELWPLLEVMTERAIELRENVSAYDASYVALAEILKCPLVTADARLGRAVEDLVDVIVV